MKREEYELLNGIHYDDATYVYAGADINAVADLIESLRAVARAAERVLLHNILHKPPFVLVNIADVDAIQDALAALPAWVLESE